MLSQAKLILELEGIGGFFAGVTSMMIGKALIKSVAFGSNQLALDALNNGSDSYLSLWNHSDGSEANNSVVALLLAASFAGFVASFIVAPVGEF